MPKMIATKKFRYPSGPNAQEHNPGDEVDVLTDRDAKALRLIKVAKDAPPSETPKEPPPAPKNESGRPTLKPEPSLSPRSSRPVEPMSTSSMRAESGGSSEPDPSQAGPARRQRTYKRDDMTAEESKD